jgi:DNA replication and repair protein RecF
VHLERLAVRDFRSWESGEFAFAPGLTVVVGDNGSGKTNLLEAIAYLAQLRSFRGAPTEALVRLGTDRAVLRASATVNQRAMLFEAEINPTGRSRMLVNKQPLARTRDARDGIVISVFTPDDLVLVKGGPGERRDYLDEILRVLHPRNDALLKDLEGVLRQRNALLKQAAGRLSKEVGFTLDVWDAKLAQVGEAVADARIALVVDLWSPVTNAYADIADRPAPVSLSYRPSFPTGRLAEKLAATRDDDIRRCLTLVGPHRDDVDLQIEARPSRTHASQGEQRTLALALRLGAHRLLTDRLGIAPILLLDDVFSELDATRSDALVRHLPPGQAIMATAGVVPRAARPESTLRIGRVRDGSFVAGSPVDKPVESVEETAQDRVTSRESSLLIAESMETLSASTAANFGNRPG